MDSQPKRPYERPLFEATDVFGVEAAAGSCCRGTGVCTNAQRNPQKTTIDLNKARTSAVS